ncbi:hypothetical protein J4225_04055 [Candidatus Pacearchaeota archaeon]|nr:hypothetical protein [Candidatus Pacearchaeota archaeon]
MGKKTVYTENKLHSNCLLFSVPQSPNKNTQGLCDKKGLSGVISVLILITLVVVAIGIIWTVINQMIKGNLEQAGTCSDIFDKIKLNKVYTCWQNQSDGTYNDMTQVSINVENIEVEKFGVSIMSKGNSKGFELIDGQSAIFIKNSGAGTNFGNPLELPGKNAGKTYIVDTSLPFFSFTDVPESVKLSAFIDGQDCGVVDIASEIGKCAAGIIVS